MQAQALRPIADILSQGAGPLPTAWVGPISHMRTAHTLVFRERTYPDLSEIHASPQLDRDIK